MAEDKDLSIKLTGYGVYVTKFDGSIFISNIQLDGRPTLDPDGCIEWVPLTDPFNQQFLNIINSKFGTHLTMGQFGKYRTVSEIRALANKMSN
jgi:hypothetical protein